MLLQRRGLRISPAAALYYTAPCCLGFLAIPWACLELPQVNLTCAFVFLWFILRHFLGPSSMNQHVGGESIAGDVRLPLMHPW